MSLLFIFTVPDGGVGGGCVCVCVGVGVCFGVGLSVMGVLGRGGNTGLEWSERWGVCVCVCVCVQPNWKVFMHG